MAPTRTHGHAWPNPHTQAHAHTHIYVHARMQTHLGCVRNPTDPAVLFSAAAWFRPQLRIRVHIRIHSYTRIHEHMCIHDRAIIARVGNPTVPAVSNSAAVWFSPLAHLQVHVDRHGQIHIHMLMHLRTYTCTSICRQISRACATQPIPLLHFPQPRGLCGHIQAHRHMFRNYVSELACICS